MTAFRALLLGLVLGSCTPDPTIVWVTVHARAAVRDPASLRVTVANAGGSRIQTFPLLAVQEFPVTFTVTPTGRSGDLQLAVEALADDGVVVGAAAGSTLILAEQQSDLVVTLSPLDFVVNESVVGDQALAATGGGRTLARRPTGGFFVVWASCTASSCDIVGRLFDDATAPLLNGTSMDDGELVVDLGADSASSPVVAASTAGFLAVWSAGDPAEIRAAPLAADGAHLESADLVISSVATAATSPVIAALAGGSSYVVAWEQARSDGRGGEIRARLVGGDGVPVAEILVDGGPSTSPNVVALPDGGFAVAWVETNSATYSSLPYVELFAADGTPAATGPRRVSPYTIGASREPSLAFVDGNLWVAWQASTLSDQYPLLASRPLVARRVGLDGELLTDLVILEEATFAAEATAVLAAYEDRLALTWVDCQEGECDIRLRLFHATGLALGGRQSLALNGAQRTPALLGLADSLLVAWSDESRRTPDVDGDAVRARAIYPETILRDGTIGATCGRGESPCESGTTCAGPGFGFCHSVCELTDGEPCPAGGTCQDGACRFDL